MSCTTVNNSDSIDDIDINYHLIACKQCKLPAVIGLHHDTGFWAILSPLRAILSNEAYMEISDLEHTIEY